MIIFKEDSVWGRTYALGEDGLPQFTKDIISNNIGALANTVVSPGNNPIFISSDFNVYELIANEFGLIRIVEKISEGVNFVREYVEGYTIKYSDYNRNTGEVYWIDEGDTWVLVYNYKRSIQTKAHCFYEYEMNGEIYGIASFPLTDPSIGEPMSYIVLNYGTTNYDVAWWSGFDTYDWDWNNEYYTIDCSLKFNPISFGYPTFRKLITSVVVSSLEYGAVGMHILPDMLTQEMSVNDYDEYGTNQVISSRAFSFGAFQFSDLSFVIPVNLTNDAIAFAQKVMVLCDGVYEFNVTIESIPGRLFYLKSVVVNAVIEQEA